MSRQCFKRGLKALANIKRKDALVLFFFVFLILYQGNFAFHSQHAQSINPHLSALQDMDSKLPKIHQHQGKLSIFIAIGTAPSNSELRTTLRENWLKRCHELSDVCSYRFFSEYSNANEINRGLNHESQLHGDMVVTHGKGGYSHFGDRGLEMLEYALQHLEYFDYFLRVDDDGMLCLDRLLLDLETKPRYRLVMGKYWCWGNRRMDENFLLFSYDVVELLSRVWKQSDFFVNVLTIALNLGVIMPLLDLVVYDTQTLIDSQAAPKHASQLQFQYKPQNVERYKSFCDYYIWAHHVNNSKVMQQASKPHSTTSTRSIVQSIQPICYNHKQQNKFRQFVGINTIPFLNTEVSVGYMNKTYRLPDVKFNVTLRNQIYDQIINSWYMVYRTAITKKCLPFINRLFKPLPTRKQTDYSPVSIHSLIGSGELHLRLLIEYSTGRYTGSEQAASHLLSILPTTGALEGDRFVAIHSTDAVDESDDKNKKRILLVRHPILALVNNFLQSRFEKSFQEPFIIRSTELFADEAGFLERWVEYYYSSLMAISKQATVSGLKRSFREKTNAIRVFDFDRLMNDDSQLRKTCSFVSDTFTSERLECSVEIIRFFSLIQHVSIDGHTYRVSNYEFTTAQLTQLIRSDSRSKAKLELLWEQLLRLVAKKSINLLEVFEYRLDSIL